ncbi:hypothetical protein NPIL_13771 [Nephila pilipes]|uniref:Uncharacterized protein n=1 Tax=Nephila pilipes TaxID=299642 RepID=A0A8X6MN52_NEPPI|nr:hypothetical protein NPIL_13771 [Nephila pilipes]
MDPGGCRILIAQPPGRDSVKPRSSIVVCFSRGSKEFIPDLTLIRKGNDDKGGDYGLNGYRVRMSGLEPEGMDNRSEILKSSGTCWVLQVSGC